MLFDAHFYQFQDEYKGYDYFQHAALTLESRRESLGLLAVGTRSSWANGAWAIRWII